MKDKWHYVGVESGLADSSYDGASKVDSCIYGQSTERGHAALVKSKGVN